MARMIPSVVHPAVKSGAERRLFDTLREAPDTDGWVCLHSLGLARHESKRRGEIDFLLLTRLGVFVIEVKGGRISRQDGRWIHTDRFGQQSIRHESPFDQASSAMFALEKDIRAHFGADSRLSRLLFGYGVMLPDVQFESVGVEADRSLVYDVRDRRNPLTQFIQRLGVFARETSPSLRYAPRDEDIEELLKFLRPDFDLVPSLGVQIDDASHKLLSLAEEQYAIVDAFANSPRLLVQGGAGTGKTLLALECCIREASTSGNRVLFLCYNRLLASFLADRVDARCGTSVRVSTVFSWMNELISGSSLAEEFKEASSHFKDQELYDRLFPEYACVAALESEPMDVLILDEGQDVMRQPALDVMDSALRGGLESGRWRVFCDINNQGAVYGRFDPEALDRIHRLGRSSILSTNRRNTRQIADETTMLTAPQVRSTGVVSGTPVEYAWYEDDKTQVDKLQAVLKRLLKQGVSPGQITILSPRSIDACCAMHLRDPRALQVTAENAGDVVAGRLKYLSCATVSSFKGLENDFIVITDLESLDSDWWRSVAYVGMSRARAGLCMLLNEGLKDTYESRLRDWIRKKV